MKRVAVIAVVTAIYLVQPVWANEVEHDHQENQRAETMMDEHSDHSNTTAEYEEHAEHGRLEKDDHEGENGGRDEEGTAVELTAESMRIAGIVVEPLAYQDLEGEVKAPGEVKLNSYLSSKVTPRVTAQVVDRRVQLGDSVVKGQPLVTLSSVEMAEAVGGLLVAHKEWARVKQLGPSAVSAKRYNEARIEHEQALAKASAYGMGHAQIQKILKAGTAGAPGEFQLAAPQAGTVVSDDFIVGELIEPGRVLFSIVNESVLWVESRLSPEQAKDIDVGGAARVHVPDNGWLQARVVQKHHLLDEETRTIGVRIEVDNEEDRLHPGMYVDTRMQSGEGEKYLAVPTAAILRSPDGDWVIFIEEDAGQFRSQEVEISRSIEDYSVIEGADEGTRIVIEGAFFVQSELAKSGFEVHNH